MSTLHYIVATFLKIQPIEIENTRIQKGHGVTYHLGAPYHEHRAPS